MEDEAKKKNSMIPYLNFLNGPAASTSPQVGSWELNYSW